MGIPNVEIYTDGSAAPTNPGVGGWGAVLLCNELDYKKEISGGYEHSTNNRMELLAPIRALESLKPKSTGNVTIYSDSAYVVNAFNKNWIDGWLKSNFKNGKVKNIDLWKQLIALNDQYSVTFVKVKAHSGIEWNERADALCVIGSKSELLRDDVYMDECENEDR